MVMVLGVDSSTQATKVEVRDVESGEVVALARAAHPPTTPPRSEQDPSTWWSALVDAITQVPEKYRRRVAAISVAGQQHGLVVLDSHGAPLRPAKLWNDTESAPEAESLTSASGAAHWAEACGSVPTASFTVTKLAWLAANEPDLLGRIASIMLPHDYLTWRLTGERVTDRGDASGTGWWSPHRGAYDHDLFRLAAVSLDPAELLPTVLGPTEVVGPLEANELLDLGVGEAIEREVLVAPGTGDNMAGALGLGLAPGDVAISIGTSGTVYGVSATPTNDVSGTVAGFADATGNFLPLVCTLNATKVTDSFGRLLGLDPVALSETALRSTAGAGGVVVVPYFDGERTPNLPDATGTVAGLRSDIEPPELARAAFEGVACGLLDGFDALADAGVAIGERVFLIGGGSKSAAYRRVMADLMVTPIVVPDSEETVATGACVQAAAVQEGSGLDEVAQRWKLGSGVVIEPEPCDVASIRGRYRKEARRYG